MLIKIPILVAAMTVCFVVSPVRAQDYQVVDLGPVAGIIAPADIQGVRLNNVTGAGLDPSYILPAVQIATLQDDRGKMTAVRIVDGQIGPLGTLGGEETIVHDVNFFGVNPCFNTRVVGASQTVDSFFHAFIWDEVVGPSDLGTLGGDESSALAINDTRQVVGWAQDGLGVRHATLWDGIVGPTDLDALVGQTGPSHANDIGNFGHIVGQAKYSGFAQATAWVRDINGAIIPIQLGALGGDESEATCVDASRGAGGAMPCRYFAGGWAETTPGGARQAAMWDVDTISQVVIITGLGTLGGVDSFVHDVTHVAEGVNPCYVGRSDISPLAGNGASEHAFLWDETNGMRDLNDLIDPNSGWELISADSINTSGMISGIGLINGEYRGFRLEPTNPPQPCPADANGDGVVNILDLLQVLASWGGC